MRPGGGCSHRSVTVAKSTSLKHSQQQQETSQFVCLFVFFLLLNFNYKFLIDRTSAHANAWSFHFVQKEKRKILASYFIILKSVSDNWANSYYMVPFYVRICGLFNLLAQSIEDLPLLIYSFVVTFAVWAGWRPGSCRESSFLVSFFYFCRRLLFVSISEIV